jgi:crossover junction endodeoxyribonuclease RuvC
LSIIFGIDPGIATTGYGIIEENKGHLSFLAHGCITTKPGEQSKRLAILHQELQELLRTYQPSCIAVEQLYFSKNTTTALSVSEARGVILLTAALLSIPVFEYTPKQVKLAVTGSGSADKHQMQAMVTRILRLHSIPKPDDAADGLAIALCHIQMHRGKMKND